jgi:adenylate cyclase class IV
MSEEKTNTTPEEVKAEELKIEEPKLAPFTEFETKYLTNIGMLDRFKKIAESLPNLLSFQYAQGPDSFFENPNIPLTSVRFRRSEYPDANGDYYQQLTSKTKMSDASNNIQRKEPNLMVSSSVDEIRNFIDSIGFVYTHCLKKQCHIYAYPECTIVFYTVISEEVTEPEHFVEIEIDEATIHNLTKTEAWGVIEKYEKILSSIDGVSAKKRLKLSLRERYKKKI